jgi:hypothetical protein
MASAAQTAAGIDRGVLRSVSSVPESAAAPTHVVTRHVSLGGVLAVEDLRSKSSGRSLAALMVRLIAPAPSHVDRFDAPFKGHVFEADTCAGR